MILLILLLFVIYRYRHLLTTESFAIYGDISNDYLLNGSFPLTGNKEITKNMYSDIWWNYPVFKLGSYAQITNNIRYPDNPDDGKCTPASMCDALYKNIKNKSNYVKELPPLNPNCNGVRIGYFTGDDRHLL